MNWNVKTDLQLCSDVFRFQVTHAHRDVRVILCFTDRKMNKVKNIYLRETFRISLSVCVHQLHCWNLERFLFGRNHSPFPVLWCGNQTMGFICGIIRTRQFGSD